jgi:hypothetical protein
VSAKLTINSDDFLSQLRKLPDELKAEGAHMVEARANGAHATIKGEYGAHKHSGNLMDHTSVEIEESSGGSVAVVKATAKHAFIFENGTQIRKNKKGANRGAMPAGNVFIPAMIRARRLLTEDLVGLLERAGLVVRRV